jgi:hypothetical protein
MADLTTQILIEIRDEIRATRVDLSSRIDQTNGRLDQMNGRIDQTNERLDLTNGRLEQVAKRQVEAEIRLSTEVVALTGVVRELRDTLLEDRHLRQTVDNHEQRLRQLESRT